MEPRTVIKDSDECRTAIAVACGTEDGYTLEFEFFDHLEPCAPLYGSEAIY